MYRKFKADHLFTGTEMLGSNKILITKNDGEIEAIINEDDIVEDIEIFKGILTPGFINAHCHLELSHMKDLIPEKTGLVDFVYKVVSERHFAEEEIQNAIETAEDEMLLNGIVAVGDICNNLLTLPQKQKQRLAYYNFIETSGWLLAIAQPRFERALNLYKEFSTTNYKLQTTNSSIVPHAPYSVSDELWKLISPFFENKVASIHNQETLFEDEFFLHGTGDFVRMYQLMNIDNTHHQPTNKSSLQSYFSKLSKATSVILVHNTFTKQEDVDYIKQKSANHLVSFCICINANKYIENTVPPIELLKNNDCNIVLGTDSLASNSSLNLLDEMKTIQKEFPGISLNNMLQWGTINGARSLQMEKVLGSFENGKKPGVVLIENTEGLKLRKDSISKRIL